MDVYEKNIKNVCISYFFLLFSNAVFAFATDLHGSYGSLTVGNSNTLNTFSDTSIAFLHGVDQSTINVNGGTISWLNLHDNNVTNVYSGDISWLRVYANSMVNVYGLDDLSWLIVSGFAKVNIYGTDFNYTGGHLSGVWGDGKAFSFWAIKEFGYPSDLMPENIILRSPIKEAVKVPEPSVISVFVIGLLVVGFRLLKTGK